MDLLVEQLSKGRHPIVASRINHSAVTLKDSIDRGYVLIKFINTKGGTELGLNLDTEATNLNGANFDQAAGQVHLVGDLSLNYINVRCIADVDLTSLEGEGHLEVV